MDEKTMQDISEELDTLMRKFDNECPKGGERLMDMMMSDMLMCRQLEQLDKDNVADRYIPHMKDYTSLCDSICKVRLALMLMSSAFSDTEGSLLKVVGEDDCIKILESNMQAISSVNSYMMELRKLRNRMAYKMLEGNMSYPDPRLRG